ncbi:DNA mismatch repair protein PMS2 [Exophiala aquamarina CBS 119918]|uniref:DNA mismatch repair protein PMS1 n=1 Tax=Exophiala aquamarina CBS 119918 TaxID=1182545 RepID=A0A072PQL5_9EURO|nr:DNA mismatch repair protein PMS2 [Exophiala aquamarina CBS 119918]KEF57765.1 DNA mismatch repair protein PMS2 [Exophiala aquamarina CBS 119918]
MATIKAIEAKSVHQIQSGQVIVDISSVAKELIENSLDAGATSVEVRFKNYGLDAIEVQDNGSGIAPANYEHIALKHYTSKLSSYDELSNLQTFGFRGEALSSLCALSRFSVTTAQSDEVPKGKRLEFDIMGKLKSTTIVASQKGTTASVEGLFESLPVRRKELTKNIKREYGKVLGLLQAYACISVNVKFTVKHAVTKGKSMTVFSTKGNASTRDNIANVYGAKTLSALVSLDLTLEYQSTLTQMARKEKHTNIQVQGHISRPVFGEGRQTPDRQMFFVNGRPCGLPQIAKAINEVYRSFNVSQSPFIFADFRMDTNTYDVNVSPDKRTILLHDSASLIESLKGALTEMFDQQEQIVPQSQLRVPKLPVFKSLALQRQSSRLSPENDFGGASALEKSADQGNSDDVDYEEDSPRPLPREHFRTFTSTKEKPEPGGDEKWDAKVQTNRERKATNATEKLAEDAERETEEDTVDIVGEQTEEEGGEEEEDEPSQVGPSKIHVRDFNVRMAEQQLKSPIDKASVAARYEQQISSKPAVHPPQNESGPVPNAFDRMRPRRTPAELATITIGDKTVTTVLGMQTLHPSGGESVAPRRRNDTASTIFSQKLQRFGASRAEITENEDSDESDREDHPDAEDESEIDDQPEHASSASEPDEPDGTGSDPSANEIGDHSDEDYIDEDEKKRAEEARVAELVRAAEESSNIPTKETVRRARKALTSVQARNSTTNLATTVDVSIPSISRQMSRLCESKAEIGDQPQSASDEQTERNAEERLSLTVAKADFAKMKIVGQFNLGFILAVRPHEPTCDLSKPSNEDELFIIDQHASDEKYNFERLQAETVVGNQRLVRSVILDLTAVEEEIVLENHEVLERNGFLVEIDTSGESVVGQRCKLISLPLSKEVVFNTKDLEELIQLLAEAPGLGGSEVVRPSKVRKMFAMRACRSSIMIGKTLSWKQMEKVVTHMGTIDKPWNCPHGRPTMRHLCGLSQFEPWREGNSEYGEEVMGLGEVLQTYASGH